MSLLLRLRYLPYLAARRIGTVNIACFLALNVDVVREAALPPGFSVEWMTADRLRELVEKQTEGVDESHVQTLKNTAAQCVGVFHSDELAGIAWFITGDVPGELNHDGNLRTMLPIYLPHDTSFIFGVYVLPRFRGNRLYAVMVSEIAKVMPSRGLTTLLVTTERSNYRALRIVRRMGFREIGRTMLLRFGPLCWTKYPKLPLAGSVRVGRYAGDTRAVPCVAAS